MKFINFLLLIFIIRRYSLYKKNNFKRHLDESYEYAHFSKITRDNFYLFPELLLTRPRFFILKSGESIYIPPKWWHWVRTDKDTVAVSYWSNEALECEIPYKFESENKDIHCDVIENINKKSDFFYKWDCDNDTFGLGNIDRYLITLPGYSSRIDKMNCELLECIPDSMNPIKFNNPDKNLWISSPHNTHDTGLHYDDLHGVLTVLKGTKYITLFSPYDGKYLHPYDLMPSWVSNPTKVEYNVYHRINKLPNTCFSSSRLLYESLNNAKHRISILQNIKSIKSDTVWGCKQMYNSPQMRWEFYTYNYDINSDKPMCPINGKIIKSVDFYDTEYVIGKDTHEYYCIGGKLMLPFFGIGTTNSKTLEGKCVLDRSENVKKNAHDYFKKIGFDEVPFELLNKYPCKDICVWNKFNDTYFIQYLGISLHDFINFISTHNYPVHLVQHVKSNMSKYRDIIHEITIVYDKNGDVVRSGFYGII